MLLSRRRFLVKERVALVKLTDTYDLFDPDTQTPLGHAREEPPGWATFARLMVNKRLLPTVVNVYSSDSSAPVLTLRKSPGIFRHSVSVLDGDGVLLGKLRSKVFSLGGGFFVDDASGNNYAEVKGDWKGWNFRILTASGEELGMVTKKWAGLGKEMFTSADNYMISLAEDNEGDAADVALMLAAGLAIDVVFKEGG